MSITIDEVLGEAELTNSDSIEWQKLYKESNILGAKTGEVCVKVDEVSPGSCGDRNGEDQIIPFETFLALRAVEDIASALNS